MKPYPGSILCYVDGNRAYFTTDTLENQWGDDWDDAPYEHNAGCPYCMEGQLIGMVFFDGPFETPADLGRGNSNYSVQMINRGSIAWLAPERWSDSPNAKPIMAGTKYRDFVKLVKLAGGNVYEPVD